jgi:hypothetical protein
LANHAKTVKLKRVRINPTFFFFVVRGLEKQRNTRKKKDGQLRTRNNPPCAC